MDYTRLKDNWSAFYSLLSNDKGIRLRLNIPDTVVLELGQPAAWYFTSKEGYVQRQPPGKMALADVRQHFLRYAMDGNGYTSKHVAIMRLADGLPKLLSKQDFSALCDRLEAQLASREAGTMDDVPYLLQAYIPPFLDLRYVTSYTNDGVDISCQTFQRRFSRRYVAWRDPSPPALLANALSTGADLANYLEAATESGAPAVDASTVLDAAADEAAVQLDDRALADMERSLDKTLGPLDPSLKMQMRKAAHGLVQYVQKAQGLTLRGLVCEFLRDSAGDVFFMGTVRTDWASLIPGRGGEPWANANLVQAVREEESGEMGAQVWTRCGHTVDHCAGGHTVEDPGAPYGADSGAGGMTIIDETTTSVTILSPSGERQTRTMSQRHVHHTPSMSGDPSPKFSITEVASTSPTTQPPDSPRIAALRSPAACPERSSSPSIAKASMHRAADVHTAEGKARSAGCQPSSPHQGTLLKMSLMTRSPGSTRLDRSPGTTVRSPPTLYGEWHHVNDGRKGASLLTSQLTRELVTLKDELIMKTEVADTLAAKVQALEHDKHVITDAFERVAAEMQGDLQEVRGRLTALRVERDNLARQLEEAQQRLSSSEAERDEYRGKLEGERGTAMTSLGEFQRKQDEALVKAAQAERDLKSLQEKFREEQVAYDALKKQMVFYQHTLTAAGLKRGGESFKDPTLSSRGERPELTANPAVALLRVQNNPEIKFWETLSAVEDLLNREADPEGERYALAKVLHTCQGDLHAIFLYYCLLDSTFARYWPPQLTIIGWMAFVKDIALTNLVPGTRTRTDATIPVAEAQEMFKRYCVRQALIAGSTTITAGPYMKVRQDGRGGSSEPARPPTATSTASALASGRPSITAATLLPANSTLTFEGFCAVLVNVAARLARASPDTLTDNPFLSEQIRSFIEDISPRAQRVTCLRDAGAKRAPQQGPGGAAAATAKQDKAAREAAAKVPKLLKLKKTKSQVSCSAHN